MRFQPTVDDLDDIHVTASSVEPFSRPDHKSKKHPRPARQNEVLGGGHFVFRRHADGRIHPRRDPYEYGTRADAVTEMNRLAELTGDTFEVYSRSATLPVVVDFDAACLDALDELYGDDVDDYATEGSGDLYGDEPVAPKDIEYETCCDCRGSGLALNGAGEPDECNLCGGNTVTMRKAGAA